MRRKDPEPKPLFLERMRALLPDTQDFERYLAMLSKPLRNSIRVNTLKISPELLKEKLTAKGWKIEQPFTAFPEILVVVNDLLPGELGSALEHLLGYYYVQELSSMLPVLVLKPQPDELVLDLCASPGSKTTQMAARMENKGTIIANEVSLGRIKILASNLERCGVANTIITRKDGVALCNRLQKQGMLFDKILVDAPCSGEGTIRSSPRTCVMWSIHTIRKLSKIQKHLVEVAFRLLNVGGEMVYSTCTHAPEENEAVADFLFTTFGDAVAIEHISFPLSTRKGITQWKDVSYDPRVQQTVRVYPQDADTEGFFISKFRKVKAL